MLSPVHSDSNAPRDPSRSAPVHIRAARSVDRGRILTLTRSAFRELGNYDRFVEEWFADRAVTTHVAETSGRVVGFTMVTTYDDPDRPRELIADLMAIAVDPGHQRRGVAKQLMAHLHAIVSTAEPSVDAIWLVVAENNQRARRLFHQHGFRLGRGVGIYPYGQKALRMMKRLSVPRE